MRAFAAFCICSALLAALPPAAGARSPLKREDMKNIRADAREKAAAFKGAYGARRARVGCREVTLYTARCRIRLFGAVGEAGGRHNCTISVVYVVTRDKRIAVDVARDSC